MPQPCFAGNPHVRLVTKRFAGVDDAEGRVDALQGLPIPAATAPVLVRTAHQEAPYESLHQSTVYNIQLTSILRAEAVRPTQGNVNMDTTGAAQPPQTNCRLRQMQAGLPQTISVLHPAGPPPQRRPPPPHPPHSPAPAPHSPMAASSAAA